MKLTLKKFWYQLANWSQNTFGTDNKRGPKGPLLHLKKEVDEAKLEVNKKRKWPKPTSDLPVEHDRNEN